MKVEGGSPIPLDGVAAVENDEVTPVGFDVTLEVTAGVDPNVGAMTVVVGGPVVGHRWLQSTTPGLAQQL